MREFLEKMRIPALIVWICYTVSTFPIWVDTTVTEMTVILSVLSLGCYYVRWEMKKYDEEKNAHRIDL